MPLSKEPADDMKLSSPQHMAGARHTPGATPVPQTPLSPDTPLPLETVNPIYSPVLTRDEMSEISTRKVRILLPSEAARLARAEMAAMATKKMQVMLPSTNSETSVAADPALKTAAHPARAFWLRWYAALKKILPVYVSVHLALLAISSLAFLYTNHDFASTIMRVYTLWTQWHHWDTGIYLQIALHGYVNAQQLGFFPLYPMLERAVMTVTGDPFTAGMIISNLAELVMFTVLYRLIERDFGSERAFYTVLYFAIFPTAFFFSIAYTEATFLCFSTLTFYQIRSGRWWLAALFGFLACLTRPDGMFLAIPFFYEYLSRKWPQQATSLRTFLAWKHISTLLKSIRFDILLFLFIPMGIGCVIAYGYLKFGDPLAFYHAHATWGRFLTIPGYGIANAFWAIHLHGLLSFTGMRTLTDLLPVLLVGTLVLLCFFGKWRLEPKFWAYGLYALALFTYFQLFTRGGTFPLESMSRFILEIFPAFLLLSHFRKNRLVHLSYFMISLATFFFLATQFATGHWVL